MNCVASIVTTNENVEGYKPGVHIVVMDIMNDVRYSFDLLLTSVDLGICARKRKPMRYHPAGVIPQCSQDSTGRSPSQ
jgi:hypothetical protein